MTAVEIGTLDERLARCCPVDMLADAPLWALVIWCRPHPNDVGLVTMGSLTPGSQVPHVQNPARRCNVVGTFFDEDAARGALDIATETLTSLILFGTPASNGSDHASLAAVNLNNVREMFTVDLRELMEAGRAEHVKRLRVAFGEPIGNREHRVIDLDGDAGDPAPESHIPFPPDPMDGLDFNAVTAEAQAELLRGMGIPEHVLRGTTAPVAAMTSVRAAQDELARRSQRPSREPRDAR